MNRQTGNIVWGAELSGDWARLRGSNIAPLFTHFSNNTNASALYTATARVGIARDQWLGYVKGGAAWLDEKQFWRCLGVTGTGACLPVGATPQHGTDTRVGWLIGLGLEYGLTQNLSFALEYDYAGFGTHRTTIASDPGYNCGAGAGVSCPFDIKEHMSMITARLNWRFGDPWGKGPVVAKY